MGNMSGEKGGEGRLGRRGEAGVGARYLSLPKALVISQFLEALHVFDMFTLLGFGFEDT